MSSTSASPLHDLWSILLSKVGGAHIEHGDNNIITNNELGPAPRAGGKAAAKDVVRAFRINPKLGRHAHVHSKSTVELFTIPDHLSAKQAHIIVKLG